ncbi:hypothetical protein EAE99_010803 [Botrytis elliptica]|nr:hypothetical protein EAE99_010803 [Botrytis elliptica]
MSSHFPPNPQISPAGHPPFTHLHPFSSASLSDISSPPYPEILSPPPPHFTLKVQTTHHPPIPSITDPSTPHPIFPSSHYTTNSQVPKHTTKSKISKRIFPFPKSHALPINVHSHLHPAEHTLPFNSDSDRNSNLNIILLLHVTSLSVKQAQKYHSPPEIHANRILTFKPCINLQPYH